MTVQQIGRTDILPAPADVIVMNKHVSHTHEHNDRLLPAMDDDSVDPFSHEVIMPRWKWVRTYFLAATLLPIRLLLVCLCVFLSYLMSKLSMVGMDEKALDEFPMLGWRRSVKGVANLFSRLVFFVGGFHNITVKGRRASASEAPVLVVAPHTSFFDAYAVFWSGLPYLVSRHENRALPFLGKCIECAQPLFVRREDPKSRQNTVREIIRRSTCGDPWPQLLIFPEGSTSNGQALMTFKPGAFYPGKPVQPIVLRYPNAVDTTTWTWNQSHGAMSVLWLTLTQLHTNAEMEFLPVYYPSEAEKADAKLYAANVRAVMAAAMGIPTVDFTFEEVKARYGALYKKKRKTKVQ